MNANTIVTDRFSSADSKALYDLGWPTEPSLAEQHQNGRQCGGCTFFAPFNADYGLCCGRASRHFTETVFEHFTCPSQLDEGWGPHSFSADPDFRCRCEGEPVYRTLQVVLAMAGDRAQDPELASHLRVLRRYVEAQEAREHGR